MTEPKKIAIAACHEKVNFGSMLQAYATETYLKSIGCDAKTIDKSKLGKAISKGRNSYYAEHLFDAELYRAKLGFVGHRLKQKLNKDFGAKMAQRKQAFAEFERRHFDLTEPTSSFNELASLVSEFDTVLVGSDQLWLPVNIAGRYYTLEFVPAGTRRVSYSTSFGVSTLPQKYMVRTREFLSCFDAISVREATGATLIEKATGTRCEVVCDPTMLLTREQWQAIANESKIEVPSEPYAFCYFLGKNLWNRECAQRLAIEHGYKLVAIAHPDEYVASDDEYADIYPWGAGPAEWVALLSNAAYVCTDSFHGSVFANLFNVPFSSFRRHENMGAQSTNSRIDTLLGVLGNSERICESKDAFDAMVAQEIDFKAVQSNLSAYRQKSTEWLAKALQVEV